MLGLNTLQSVQQNLVKKFGKTLSSYYYEDIEKINNRINSDNEKDKITTLPTQENIYKIILKGFFYDETK